MSLPKRNRKSPIKTAKRVLDITVLMGGPVHRAGEVSLVSGEAIAAALERNGHQVTRSDISPADLSALDRKGIDVVFIACTGRSARAARCRRSATIAVCGISARRPWPASGR